MHILYVTNDVPDPEGGGSPRRAAMHLRALARLGRVTMIVPPLDGAELKIAGVEEVFEREPTLAETRNWLYEGSRSRLKRVIHASRKLNNVDARASSRDRSRFPGLLSQPFDLLFAFRLRSVVWWESIFGRTETTRFWRVVDFDDVESLIFEARIKGETDRFWQWKYRQELAWLKRTEVRVARQLDAFCQCSEVDVQRMKAFSGRTAWQIPNAYDFAPVVRPTEGALTNLLFVGTLSYFPNVEGIKWFMAGAWPDICSSLQGEVRLDIVGLRPPDEILAFRELPGVEVNGNVPSVVPHYHAADIVIAPLLAGSGTRIKLIEAAALGRPIVATSRACEGLGFVDGVHAEIADDAVDFGRRVVELARDPGRRARLADAARGLAETSFSASAITAQLEYKLRSLVASETAAPEGP